MFFQKTLLLFLFTSFLANGQELTRYSCDVDRLNISGFESSRNFDEYGVIKSKGKYHPLAIAQYGLLTYYKFKETRDSSFYKKFINQIAFFKDTNNYDVLFQGRGLALPYRFNFWDMKKNWYSGMTQGYALSLLLRYKSLSQDNKIDTIIKKIAFQMIQPQANGGTISKTPEGYTWIEEYPNSKKSPQVLNGFINGLIGLHEYCIYFPGDTLTSRIEKEALTSIQRTLDLFDSEKWSYYNRKKRSISNKYLRYQIFEMIHLHEIYKIDLFESQARIWSFFTNNKFIKDNSKHHRFRDYNFSSLMNDGNFTQNKVVTFIDSSSIKEKRHLFFNKKTTVNTNLKRTDIMHVASSKKLKKTDIKILSNGKNIEYDTYTKDSIYYLSLSNANDNNSFDLSYKKSKGVKFLASEMILSEKLPLFGHILKKNIILDSLCDYKIIFDTNLKFGIKIFYRNASNTKNLNKTKWKAVNQIINNQFTTTNQLYYDFLFTFDYKTPYGYIKNIQFLTK